MPTDIFADYETTLIPLAPDDEGEVVATVVHRRCPHPSKAAVLYIHGFVDYFFQTEMADEYLANGFNFYALDLRKYGRSLLPHQTPNFVRDIKAYFEEIDAAVDMIRTRDGNETLLVNGHSTGGLIASIYAHHRRHEHHIDALFLNSPFFDFNEPWFSKKILIKIVSALGAIAPNVIMPQGLSPLYVHSLHKNYRGEWDFNLTWKPAEGFPVYLGWIRAIHRAHTELRAGLDIPCPVLVMSSTESSKPKRWDDLLRRTDTVLNVDDMSRGAQKLGDHVTCIRIAGGVHDLVLSAKPVRAKVYEELFRWLGAYLPCR